MIPLELEPTRFFDHFAATRSLSRRLQVCCTSFKTIEDSIHKFCLDVTKQLRVSKHRLQCRDPVIWSQEQTLGTGPAKFSLLKQCLQLWLSAQPMKN